MQINLTSIHIALSLILFFNFADLAAQDLDPRAYGKVPINATTVITGIALSSGEVVTEPTLQIKNIKANVQTASIGVAHSFSFFGLTSQLLVAIPYSWAKVTGDVVDTPEKVTRSGFSDMRARFSVLFLGAPAISAKEFINSKRNTILGASINVIAPTGEFFADKLINLGTNRWSFRPELAISQPIGKRLLLDFYTGVWIFTNNNNFFPGESLRTQNPLGTVQAHISYNINPLFWLALDTTYYVGGNSYVNGQSNDNRQSNSRIGITASVPTGNGSSLRLAASTGAIVRAGQNFDTFSIGWQKSWLNKK
jgi:hypothetical protein